MLLEYGMELSAKFKNYSPTWNYRILLAKILSNYLLLKKNDDWKPWNLEMCEIPRFGMCFIPAELGMNTIVLVLKSCCAGLNKCKVIYAR